jgi:glycosyltransferase involved in cell wall biosynthesis|tara:strand:+ start:243 stop:1307 length:1065 start_codon:yes stop_codon:yes gene_type:complete
MGGAGNSIFRLCKGISKKKFNISIICLKNCPYENEFRKIGIKVYKVNSNKTTFAMIKISKITKSLISKKYKKNIFVSNIHYTNVLSLIFLRNLNNLKMVLVERTPLMELSIYFGFFDAIKKFFIKLLIYLLYQFSDSIICNSISISRHFKLKYNLNTKTIFPPSVINSSQILSKVYKKNKTLIIVTICRLTKEKGLDVLIKALSFLKFNNYKLFIVGDGVEKLRLKKLSERLGIHKKIKYFGFMRNTSPVLKISNLYINSSYFEGFPNSVVEAINFGLPVISSQSYGGINEILLNGKCGTIFRNGNSVDLANKIQNFYNNPKKFFLKTKLAKRNIQRFTLKKNIFNYENLFYNL